MSIIDFLDRIKDGTEIIIRYYDYPDSIDFKGVLNAEVKSYYINNDYNVGNVSLDGAYLVITLK